MVLGESLIPESPESRPFVIPSPCYQVALETQVWFIESFHFRPLGCLILERWDCQIWLMCPSSVSLGWRNWQW